MSTRRKRRARVARLKRKFPTRGMSRKEKAHHLYVLNQLAGAEERIIKSDSDRYHFKRGHLLFGLGDKEEALSEFSIAIEISPVDSAHFESRGSVLASLDRLKEAIADYSKGLEIIEKNFEFARRNIDVRTAQEKKLQIFVKRADAYQKLHDFRSALADYQSALDMMSHLDWTISPPDRATRISKTNIEMRYDETHHLLLQQQEEGSSRTMNSGEEWSSSLSSSSSSPSPSLKKRHYGMKELFHCTDESGYSGIRSSGFRCGSSSCWAGSAIYFASTAEGARAKARKTGVMLVATVDLGTAKVLDASRSHRGITQSSLSGDGCQSVMIPAERTGDDSAVYDPGRISNIRLSRRD